MINSSSEIIVTEVNKMQIILRGLTEVKKTLKEVLIITDISKF
jgi:hypothetical protein